MAKLILDKQAIGIATPSTQSIMLLVLVALLPGTAVYAYTISPIVWVNIIAAVVAALVLESVAVGLRRTSGLQAIQDGSIAVAAYLLALAVPPTLPFWQLMIGVFIMVMLGKHVYGGLGQNIFNPAMVGYAALMISFPQNMTQWFVPVELNQIDLLELIRMKLGYGNVFTNTPQFWDGITQATPLEHVRSLNLQSLTIDSENLPLRITDSGWIWINLGFLGGGIFLLYKKIIQWHIPLTVLSSFLLMSLLFSNQGIPVHYAMFSGALILGAFFIATDPVTAASSNRGRIIFGLGVGALTFVIREYGGYPEGIAFAVLLMNLCVPLIDHLDIRFG